MIITLALALFILFVVFSRTSKKRKAGESLLKHHQKLLIVGSIVVTTIFLMNLFRPRVMLYDLDEIIENASETNNEYIAWEKREIRSKLDPTNIPKLLEYVDDTEKFENFDKASLQDETYSIIPAMQRLALAYADALVPDSTFDSLYRVEQDGTYNSDYPDTTKRYHNYVIGKQKFVDGQFTEAIQAYKREIKRNPNYEKSYPDLYLAYRRTNIEDFRKFIVDSKNARYLDQDKLVVDYFNLGEFTLYFKTIYARTFLDLNFFALIAGLVISIVWMIFLRNMDFFNKEKWSDLIIVFIGGALFTNLCLFLYHTADYDWGINLNGEFWNDFLYCFGVIGFSEELVKLIPWILFAVFTKRLKEPYDYILYATMAALGFAFTENLVYLEEPHRIVTRSITSTGMHMFAASLVAYCMVLAKFKYKTKRAKIIAPIVGFVLACFAHGFYDFWIISESAAGLEIITTIFFLLTIHIWFFMINNSTNHSSFFDKKLLRINENIEFLSISILGIILLQYVILSIEYGALSANTMLKFGSTFTIGFLLYVTFVLSNFKAIQGKWMKYSFPLVKLINEYISVPFGGGSSSTENHTGLHLRIFCPKDNKYVGTQFPVSGHCERKITINRDENWYLFRMNAGLDLPGFNTHMVILRPKSNKDELVEEKIELYLMLIPLGLDLYAENIPIKRLRYIGRTYSKPI